MILIISDCLIRGISNFSFTLGLNLDNICIGVICVFVKVDFILVMRKNQEPQDSDKTEVLRIYHSFLTKAIK